MPSADKLRVWAFLALLHISARLPLRLLQALGVIGGSLLDAIPNRVRSTVRANIDACYPHLTAAQRRRLARDSLGELGKAIAEAGAVWLWPKEKLFASIKESGSCQLFHEAFKEGRGLLVITPHIAVWELVGLYYSSLYPVTVLYRPPHRKDFEPFLCRRRSRFGARLAPTTAQGVRALYTSLARGEVVGILPDQDPGRGNGLFAPFFGNSANTMTLLSRLANKTGARVIFAYAERLPKGEGFRLHCFPAHAAISEAPLENSLAAMNAQIEQAIATAPSQYLWAYKRFKTRPTGEKSIY